MVVSKTDGCGPGTLSEVSRQTALNAYHQIVHNPNARLRGNGPLNIELWGCTTAFQGLSLPIVFFYPRARTQ